MASKQNIIIQNLSQKKDKKEILKKISLRIPLKKVVCIVGPSGCGKTSLLRCIAGLDKFQIGKILYCGKLFASPLYNVPTEKRNFGLVFQDSTLFPHLNVFQNVSFGLKSKNFKTIQKQTFNILSKIGLPHYANVFPDKLSGGQKQLVSLARSLIPKPNLLMMDEPFANLDERLKDKIRDTTLHLLQKTSTTALIVTHDPEEAMFMGDYIAVMSEGKILQFDTPYNIYNKPINSFIARFFGDTVSVRGQIKNGVIKTIFGSFKTTKYKNNSDIELVFRSESFNVQKSKHINSNQVKAKIIAIRPIGYNTMLHLDVRNKSVSKHIHIKISGKFLPPKNKICYINIDKNYVFVFTYKK